MRTKKTCSNMSRLACLIGLYLSALIASTAVCDGQAKRTVFNDPDTFKPQIELTNLMLKGANLAPEFSDCYDFAKDRTTATKVDLNGDWHPEILIEVSCGNSSTSNLFWLLRKKGRSY